MLINCICNAHIADYMETVYSILPQSTQLQNGYLALIRQCSELVRYMLPAALEYPSFFLMVSECTGLLGEEGCVNTSVDTRLYKPNTFTSNINYQIAYNFKNIWIGIVDYSLN